MVQELSRRHLNAEARVRNQTSQWGICDGYQKSGTVFLRVLVLPPSASSHRHSTHLLQYHQRHSRNHHELSITFSLMLVRYRHRARLPSSPHPVFKGEDVPNVPKLIFLAYISHSPSGRECCVQIRCKFWMSQGGVCERLSVLQTRPLNPHPPTDFITHTLTILHAFLSGYINTLTYSASKKFCCSLQYTLLLYWPMLEVYHITANGSMFSEYLSKL